MVKFHIIQETLGSLWFKYYILNSLLHFRHRLQYWKDPFNCLDLVSSLLLVSVIPFRFFSRQEQWPCFSVGYLLYTLRIFKYAAVFRLNIFIRIYKLCLKNKILSAMSNTFFTICNIEIYLQVHWCLCSNIMENHNSRLHPIYGCIHYSIDGL